MPTVTKNSGTQTQVLQRYCGVLWCACTVPVHCGVVTTTGQC
jgi:hypothetical protein